MEKCKGQPPDLGNHAVRWTAYRLRESFSLFELACLVHGLDPEAVSDDAVAAVRRHGGPLDEVFARDHVGAVKVMYNSPAMYFMSPVGDTLEAMKLTTSPTIGYSVKKDRAKRIAQGLGYQWPVELEDHTPAPVVAESAGNALGNGKVWTTEKLTEAKAYREMHGTKKTAEHYQVTASRIRQLLPGDTPKPKGYSAFTHRAK